MESLTTHLQLLSNVGCMKKTRSGFQEIKKIQDIGVTALVLSILIYFQYNPILSKKIAGHLVQLQRTDGSWWYNNDDGKAIEYCNETTLLVLEALMQYSEMIEKEAHIIAAVEKAEHFLLNNRSLKKQWLSYAFPNYWFYDYLSVMHYFARFNRPKINGMKDTIQFITDKMKHGIMPAFHSHPGKVLVKFGKEDISKWNTLRTYAVFDWGDDDDAKQIDKSKFSFDWEGGLSKLKDNFTSVELQHKAMEWR